MIDADFTIEARPGDFRHVVVCMRTDDPELAEQRAVTVGKAFEKLRLKIVKIEHIDQEQADPRPAPTPTTFPPMHAPTDDTPMSNPTCPLLAAAREIASELGVEVTVGHRIRDGEEGFVIDTWGKPGSRLPGGALARGLTLDEAFGRLLEVISRVNPEAGRNLTLLKASP